MKTRETIRGQLKELLVNKLGFSIALFANEMEATPLLRSMAPRDLLLAFHRIEETFCIQFERADLRARCCWSLQSIIDTILQYQHSASVGKHGEAAESSTAGA